MAYKGALSYEAVKTYPAREIEILVEVINEQNQKRAEALEQSKKGKKGMSMPSMPNMPTGDIGKF